MAKTRRRNILRKKTFKNRSKKGGIGYSVGTYVKHQGQAYKKILDNNIVKTSNEFSLDRPNPLMTISTLPNVFSFSNKDDTNYKYYGYFMSQIVEPIDFDSIVWAIQKYFNEEIATKIPNNVYKTDISSDIRIYDFKFQHILVPKDINSNDNKMKNAFLLQGNIYVTNMDNLNKQINEQVLGKLPEDMKYEIKSFINPKQSV
jgi:hypothetical protein